MFDKNNKNYKFYLAGIISESQYYDLCEDHPIATNDGGKLEASNDGNRMLMNNLKDIKEYADLILSMLEDHDQLDEWMENKISVCRAYMSDVGHAFKNDKDEDEEEGGCGGIPVASMGAKSMDLTPITSLYQAMR